MPHSANFPFPPPSLSPCELTRRKNYSTHSHHYHLVMQCITRILTRQLSSKVTRFVLADKVERKVDIVSDDDTQKSRAFVLVPPEVGNAMKSSHEASCPLTFDHGTKCFARCKFLNLISPR
jgi:adenosyl cobinamide kinase/adenosyl cobinamide phosphate guanylyltransferase